MNRIEQIRSNLTNRPNYASPVVQEMKADIAYLLGEIRKRDEVLAGVAKLLPIIRGLDK